jgi:hypothetical protein
MLPLARCLDALHHAEWTDMSHESVLTYNAGWPTLYVNSHNPERHMQFGVDL